MKINLIKLLNKSNKDKLLIRLIIINNNNKILNIKQLRNNNQWNIIIYNYNNNNEINNIINNNIIIELLYKIINIINGNKIFISKPIFKHNINIIIIKYYYYIPKYYINNNIINNIINRLSNILSYYYNKNIIIKPIQLSYIYINHNIFNDYIIYIINNNNNKNIDKIINNYINIFNNIILLDNNINNNNIKYLNGWSIILKGKLSNDRSKTYNLIYGSFNNNNKSYKLNYIPNNLYNGIINPLNLNINKNGKYNIKVILNYSN